MTTPIALARLCRWYYSVPLSLTYLLTVYYARNGQMAGQWPGAIRSTVALAAVLAGAYVLNDVFDRGVDRINAPKRPVAAGKVSAALAGAWAVGLTLVGLIVGATCRPDFATLLFGVVIGLVLYDVFSKRLGPLKPVVVAGLVVTLYPLAIAQAGGARGDRAGSLVVFPVWLALTAFGYELLKDVRDRAGDASIAGRATYLLRHTRRWRRVASIAITVAAPLLIAPFWLGCGWVYLAGGIAANALALAAIRAPLKRAIILVYAECFIVAVAATADVMAFG